MASHDAFHIFRRFSNVRVRLLLLTQDKIANLENQLKRVDEEEKSPLFLAASREDSNYQRKTIISELHESLKTYGQHPRHYHTNSVADGGNYR